MGTMLLPGNPAIEITLRRSARAKRIGLRISSLDGRVTLTLPPRVPEAEGRAFAQDKRDWILGHLNKQPARHLVGFGDILPIEGHPREITPGTGRRIVLQPDHLRVPGTAQTAATRIEAYLKQVARDRLAAASDHFADKLGLRYTKLTLRDTRSRWGSCTSAGGLMYSWRLIMAPADVLTYVAAHEVAHLRHMDHSAAFWQVVSDIYGDHKPQRTWLRTHGAGLHAYRFETRS